MNVNFLRRITVLAVFFMGTSVCYAKNSGRTLDLASLEIEELLDIEVSSVSKQDEALSGAASSIFVITQNDIRNSGATTIPDALRLAPHLQVAQLTSSRYAISSRGFNSTVSNKLLVLIDGRTIYSPLFSGVFWDQQDIMLEDVKRIEVISGPGAALWGSNAVNGVINIITRHAADTIGWLTAAHAGNFERGIRTRYGGSLGDTGHFRIYGKVRDTDSSIRFDDADPHDAFRNVQAGFRADWVAGSDSFTLQGDTYDGQTEDRGLARNGTPLGEVGVSGTNLLTRWRKRYNDGSALQIQAYWDYTKRRDVVLFQPRADIFDIELQHGVSLGQHRVLWGGGYRYGRDDVDPGFFSTFIPDSRTLEWKNLFIQDEFEVTDHLKATLGIKLEDNDYTGLEYLPTARLAWSHLEQSLLWTAYSRAVRAPSRYDKDVYFPAPPNSIVVGGPNFESEIANVFELGYRSQAWHRLVYSATAYYHDWDKLRSGTATLPLEIENNIEGKVYGLELWATYEFMLGWRISAGGTRLHKELRVKPASNAVGVDSDILANDPKYQAQLRSTWEASENTLLEVSLRHVAKLPHPEIPSYTAVDAHFAWQLDEQLQLSVTAQNMADTRHQEFGRPAVVNEFQRMVWLAITLRH